MIDKTVDASQRQRVFSELFISTLIYVAVLGFFSEYTDVVYAKSFSYLFIAALIMGTLTVATFWLKGMVMTHFAKIHKLAMLFGVWIVMFFSKFVFVWAIDLVLGDDVAIHGYFGIVAVVLCVTVINRLADFAYQKL